MPADNELDHGKIPSLMSLQLDKPDDTINDAKKLPPVTNISDLVLPKALEDVLAFKDQRVAELGENEPSEEPILKPI